MDDLGTIVSLSIVEMEPFAYVYMCCTKNAWGKKVIENWNEILHRVKTTPAYRKITEIGHTDEKELQRIRENYDAFINAR